MREVSALALTRSIRQFEDELHVPLLARTTRGVVLSHDGKVLLRVARDSKEKLPHLSATL